MTGEQIRHNCSAVILSGGLNTRMGGVNKAFLDVNGHNILERLLKILNPLFEDILLVTRQPDLYRDYPIRIVEDIYPSRSSLTGIHAGLCYAYSPFCFVAPCDAPFLKKELVKMILERIAPSIDVLVPVSEGKYQPLCAVYSKRCIAPIEAQLENSDYKIIHFFDKINLKTISEQTLRHVDPDLLSFYNVNTPETYENSKALCRMMPVHVRKRHER